MTRQRIFAANWKMHHGPTAARAFTERFLSLVPPSDERALWFFPPAVSLATVVAACYGRDDIAVGAQNVHWEPKGAFTGELSMAMIADTGATLALIGHSERRHVFGETDEQVARKTVAALQAGIRPLVCVGETLIEREAGRTEQVVLRQIGAVVDQVQDWSQVTIAYEPVWAIGTGKNATPEDAAQVHELIRVGLVQQGLSRDIRILYGGSVNAGNAQALLARPEIDGVLVGGASLDADGWAGLVGSGAAAVR